MQSGSPAEAVAPSISGLLDQYSESYLKQYWPEVPSSAAAWADNAVLMLAYQEAALAVKKFLGNKEAVRMLDISTGPTLAPLLAMITCVTEVQLSDHLENNRVCLQKMPIDYWRNYVPMLIRLYDNPQSKSDEILARLDELRSAKQPVEIDLFKEPPLPEHIDPSAFNLLSMQFVADSITDSTKEYFRCLGRVTDLLRPGAAIIISAVVDSDAWMLGESRQPSPKVSEETILDFLRSQNLEILYLSRSMRLSGLSYSGGWIVLSAARPNKK